MQKKRDPEYIYIHISENKNVFSSL